MYEKLKFVLTLVLALELRFDYLRPSSFLAREPPVFEPFGPLLGARPDKPADFAADVVFGSASGI